MRQKLMGLRCKNKGRVENSTFLDDCVLKPKTKIMLIGTPEEKIFGWFKEKKERRKRVEREKKERD